MSLFRRRTGSHARNMRGWALLGFSAAALVGCTYSRLHADFVPEQALRLGEAMHVLKRDEVLAQPQLYDALKKSGVADSDIRDGSVAVARVVCCGGPPEEANAVWFVIPKDLDVQPGDYVEILTGAKPSGDVTPAPNRAVKVRQRGSVGSCRWLPDKPGLWMRVLYCDGMKEEGWVQQTGLLPVWVKTQ